MADLTIDDKEYKKLQQQLQQQLHSKQEPEGNSSILRSNLQRQIAGTTVEVGSGIGLDIATQGLLGFGPLGWIGYGAINFAGGVLSNYTAQQLREVEKLGWGELLSSGFAGIIPYATHIKGLKGAKAIGGVALESAIRAPITEQLRVGIDEKRRLTPGEIGTSAVVGGALGGGFQGAITAASKLKNKLSRQILNDGEVDDVLAMGENVLFPPGSKEDYIQKHVQASTALPAGVSAREWFKRVDYNIVREEVLSQGGTEFQAKQIYRDHQKKLTGKKGIKATISELNEMWRLWEPNTQIKLVSDTETGGKKMMMMTKTGNVKTWEFDHDHIQAVVNTKRPEGGLKGADMAENIEIMFRAMNREKSNVFELDERLLRELGVPYDFKEYIFNKLNPDLVPEGIPQRWKEVFSKSILNDYYELKPNTPSSKHSALMGRLIRKYKKVFNNKELLSDLEYLEDIPFWKKYPPNEIPKWAQILEMPNDPLTDKFWNQLPPKAKKRWENMVRRKHQDLKFEMKGYKPSKGRYRIQPDD